MKFFSSFPLAALGITAVFVASVLAISRQFSSVRALSAAQATSQPPKKTPRKAKTKLTPQEIERRRNIARRTASILGACRRKIEGTVAPKVESYRADIVQEIKLGTREFTARGQYIQAKGLRRRLDLTMKFGPRGRLTTARLIEVCNGDVLTTQQIINGTPRVTRRNVRDILKATEQFSAIDEVERIRSLGLGGIGGLIASLQSTMAFDKYESKMVGSTKLFILEGTWNERFKQQLSSLTRNGRYPEHIPERVRVEIDANDLIRRIQYLKKDPKSDSYAPLMTMTLRNIELNPPDLSPKADDTAAKRKFDALFRIVLPKNAYEVNTTKVYIDQVKAAAEQTAKARQRQPR